MNLLVPSSQKRSSRHCSDTIGVSEILTWRRVIFIGLFNRIPLTASVRHLSIERHVPSLMLPFVGVLG